MADRGVWFKLWVSSLNDADLDNLDIGDFGRWAKMGAYVKGHGTCGTIKISSPARTICSMLQVSDFDALVGVIKRFPSCDLKVEKGRVTGVTNLIVTFCNWNKYQGDNSIYRVRQFRSRVTVKKRGEEKRGEEKRIPPITPPVQGAASSRDFLDIFWPSYPLKVGKGLAEDKWTARVVRKKVSLQAVMDGLERWKNSAKWAEEDGKYRTHPGTWLNQRRWEDDPPQKNKRKVLDSEKAPGWDVGSQESFK